MANKQLSLNDFRVFLDYKMKVSKFPEGNSIVPKLDEGHCLKRMGLQLKKVHIFLSAKMLFHVLE